MKVRVTKKLAEGPIEIPIHTEFIKLQDFLKFANAIESGGMAKTFIQEGDVLVNGGVPREKVTFIKISIAASIDGNCSKATRYKFDTLVSGGA